MGKVKVIVCGACGKMGQEAVRAVAKENDLELVGAVDITGEGTDIGQKALGENLGVKITGNLEATLKETKPDVMVNFTIPSAVKEQIHTSLQYGAVPVVGTTGLTEPDLQEIDRWVQNYQRGVFIAPNFALGAVLMMKFSQLAGKYFEYVEIIEQHHEQKIDAPSGTAIKTAQMIHEGRKEKEGEAGEGEGEEATRGGGTGEVAGAGTGAAGEVRGSDTRAERPEEIEKISGARGGNDNGIHLHSVRLQGRVAHQEVIFGGPGQTLTIRHDSLDRTSFMPGLMMAVRKAPGLKDLIYGMENLLDF